MIVDEVAGIIFNVPYQVGQCHGRLQPKEHMHMVFHPIDDEWLVSLILNDPGHIFKHFLPPFLVQKVLPSLHGKDNLNVDL
jgi:hypothetical protein